MAEAPKVEAAAPKKSRSKLPLILIGAVVLVGLAGAGWFWHRHSLAAAPAEQQKTSATEVKSVMHLENFVVNLQGATDSGYLRVGIDLGVAAEAKEGEKQATPPGRLRDAILTVLGTRTVDELLTPEGKAKLKQDLLQAIDDRAPEIDCKEIYFTEFLVQR
ncbi:MAG TPA: flagellar basal body-associated FliL family protein [Verrucomicrobiae bacterium]|jgi:flagellar FliL protein|nr:flagellar basal body-associated FliL family protein [Verrucomicrobiae bacterium]